MSEGNLFERTERGLQASVEWLRLFIEGMGAVVIGLGVVAALVILARSAAHRRSFDFDRVRLVFARHLALALEFQLAADILSTAIAPSWDRIGKLAAIAVIRTALNYFLFLELRSETAAGKNPPGAGPAAKPKDDTGPPDS
jgi:uncharacterized membrane protein